MRRLAGEHLLIVLAIAILLAHGAFYWRELGYDSIDDAYISFRYSQNLIQGHGLVFNIGDRVEGYTNFLWTVLLAPFLGLDLEPGRVAMALGLLFGVGTLFLLPPFKKHLPHHGSIAIATAALFLACDGSFALWSVGGMETAMFAFLVTGGALAFLGEKTFPLSGVLFALAAMTRPEGVLVFAVTFGYAILMRLIKERQPFSAIDLARLLIFIAVYGSYFLWRYSYYGYLLPNTFYIKVAVEGSEAQIARGFEHLITFLAGHWGWLLLPLAFLPLVLRRARMALGYLAFLIMVYASYIVYVGGDWSVGRFFVPILPAFYLLVGAGMEAIYQYLKPRAVPYLGVISGAVVLFLGVGLLYSSSLRGEDELFIQRFHAKEATEARVAMGRWLRDNVPSDTFVAVDAAGQIPYYSGLRTLDLFGLVDEEVAHKVKKDLGRGLPGHESFDLGYILWRRPDLIIVWGDPGWTLEGYERADWPWTSDLRLKRLLTVYGREDS